MRVNASIASQEPALSVTVNAIALTGVDARSATSAYSGLYDKNLYDK